MHSCLLIIFVANIEIIFETTKEKEEKMVSARNVRNDA
jgi:hypothetical protein